ncbi:uncharacterized protein [Atheta coriaria]|uniref:uncharacterized protein isoform X1 n=1 Tax=Dalotia coriaria TaxID=877792 RepID=UPI0031F3F50B
MADILQPMKFTTLICGACLILAVFLFIVWLMYLAHKYDILEGGQEINTVSRHAELRGQMNELPPDYSKVGGLPPAYDLVVAGNPPAYSEAIQLEINASLAHSHRSTTPATDGAHSTDLTGVVVVPPAVASQQQ